MRAIDLHKASTPEAKGDPVGGTVYLVTADRWGNMVSFIYSIYDTFGSGITVPGYGFVLNDRGALFSLDPRSPNLIAPGKRPFHTLLPGFVMKDGRPLTAFGLMGGSQQAQGHVQVLINMIDLGANLQAASDAARFSHAQATNTLDLESQLYDLVGRPAEGNGTQSGFGKRRGHGRLSGHIVHALHAVRAFERAAVCGNARVFIRPGRGGAQRNGRDGPPRDTHRRCLPRGIG